MIKNIYIFLLGFFWGQALLVYGYIRDWYVGLEHFLQNINSYF